MGDEENRDITNKDETLLLTDPPFYLPEFEQSYRYIIDEYTITPRDVAIFMPCAMTKPYSASPSHRMIRKLISEVFDKEQYHIIVFGTCGIVPAELENMYPFAHYRYMLGKCKDEEILNDFLGIETDRIAGYLEKTRNDYRYRIGYSIGIFREALIAGSAIADVPFDLVLPSRDSIKRIIEEEDCPFQEGSLLMDDYLQEFHNGLLRIRRLLD
jgi:archaeosine synthase alpha-subunit